MATDTETDAPFQIRSLIGTAGAGSNGEKLVNALTHLYPEELTAAQERRPNPVLTEGIDLDDVTKIVGDGIDVRDAVVRGGEQRSDDAWVTFAGYDEAGDTVKGAYPYPDHGKASSRDLILQTDRLQESEAARDFALAEAKRQAAEQESSEEVAALREQVEALTARLDEEPPDPEPVDGYNDANATDIAKMVGAADRPTAESVLAFERDHEDRKTVTEAAEKRIAAIDAEAEQEAAERERVHEENEALKARVAELEAQAAAPPGDEGS